MLKKVASVPTRLYSKVWPEYLVNISSFIDTALHVLLISAFYTLVDHITCFVSHTSGYMGLSLNPFSHFNVFML